MSISAIGSVVSGLSASAPGKTPGAAGMGEFATFFESIGKEAISSIRNAEHQSMTALNGGGSVREVAEAVMSAEQSLQIAVSVRDKIVSAYLEISRMAI